MFIFLDIEPDGNEDSKMFEIAYMTQNRMTASRLFKRFKPYRKNRDNDLKNSDFAMQLNELLQSPDNIMVVHNAQSKAGILKQEGIEPKQFICTLKSARFMDRLGKFPEDSLQYVRYRLDIEQEKSEIQDAFTNVFTIETIFYRLYHRLFVDMFPDGKEKKQITKKVIELVNKASEYPKPRFNTVFFETSKTNELEQTVIEKMVDISKSNLIITPNLLWKTAEDGH